MDNDVAAVRQRVCILGATGTIARATVGALLRGGHEVVCFVRPRASVNGSLTPSDIARLFDGATVKVVDPADLVSLARDGFAGERFDAVVFLHGLAHRRAQGRLGGRPSRPSERVGSCAAGPGHFVRLSAVCVQKPLLAFRHAKLAIEAALIGSGTRYSIVRPTAFFKSLSGQIERGAAFGLTLAEQKMAIVGHRQPPTTI